jgi:hypothetical protein
MSNYDAGMQEPQVSGWAIGGITFAAAMMALIGAFEVLSGLNAIINDSFYVKTANYTYDVDITAWGWIHLGFGVLILWAAFGLFSGKLWASVTALVLAMFSAIDNFFFIPYYPWWSLLIIGLDIWVIWALTRPSAVQT